MRFSGAAKRLDDIDLPRIGHRIGVGEDEVHAVLDVEASGSGFDRQKRIKMLFEPHVFYRNLEGAQRDRAVAAGLAYKSWRPGNYPADSYPRLLEAMQINETAALKSASWGLGQILGENHIAAGYDTIQEMVADFVDDEERHLEAMIQFIISKKLDDELRAHNWAGFARGYNGAGYRANKYDEKLAARFAYWRTKPDTPWSADAPAPRPPVARPAPLSPTAPAIPVQDAHPPSPVAKPWWQRLWESFLRGAA